MIETDTYLPIKAAPYQHQIEAVEFALRRLRDGGGAALLIAEYLENPKGANFAVRRRVRRRFDRWESFGKSVV